LASHRGNNRALTWSVFQTSCVNKGKGHG